MSEKLIDVLNKLDVTNDNHWTAEGMPRLETVRMLSGNQALTRDEIVKANPGFSRSFFAQNGPVVTPEPAPVQAEKVEEITQKLPDVSEHIVEDAPQQEDTEDEIEIAQKELAKLDFDLNQLKAKRDAQLRVVESLIDKQNKEAPQHPFAATQGYLHAQRKALEERATRVRAVRESGVDLKALMNSVAKSPIDVAMSRKNTRGASRPGVKK